MPVRTFRVGIVKSLSVHYQLIVLSYQTHSYLIGGWGGGGGGVEGIVGERGDMGVWVSGG